MLVFLVDLDPAPRDIRVVRVNDTVMQIFWSPIYHPPVARYIVHYIDKAESKPDVKWPLFAPTSPTANYAIIGDLKADAMYNLRVKAEFFSTNINDPSGMTRRDGDLSEIYVADIYRRKLNAERDS